MKKIATSRIKVGACRFRACGARLEPGQDPAGILDQLTSHYRMHKASHISWACRRNSDGRISDMKGDGGESGAGKVILEILRKSTRENVLIAVARWYGGKHLGGLRFRVYRKLTSEILESL